MEFVTHRKILYGTHIAAVGKAHHDKRTLVM
jgi:hypothetical protein